MHSENSDTWFSDSEITDLENIITNFITDIINNDNYNYGKNNLSANIIEIYSHHELCTLDNIQDTRQKILAHFDN